MRMETLDPFGREFFGVRADTLAGDERTAILDALSNDGVVVLRDQEIDDDAFVAFLRGFGKLTFTKGEEPLAHQPALNFVSNEGRTTPPRSVFHTDTSYVSQPPAYTALRAVRIPEQGGATVFSNQFTAF